MKVDINTRKTPKFITWPLIIGFATPYHFHTLSSNSIHMGLLYIWTLLSGIAGMFVIWYIVFCYSNKVIATIVCTVIVAAVMTFLVRTALEPTKEEIRKQTYKALHL